MPRRQLFDDGIIVHSVKGAYVAQGVDSCSVQVESSVPWFEHPCFFLNKVTTCNDGNYFLFNHHDDHFCYTVEERTVKFYEIQMFVSDIKMRLMFEHVFPMSFFPDVKKFKKAEMRIATRNIWIWDAKPGLYLYHVENELVRLLDEDYTLKVNSHMLDSTSGIVVMSLSTKDFGFILRDSFEDLYNGKSIEQCLISCPQYGPHSTTVLNAPDWISCFKFRFKSITEFSLVCIATGEDINVFEEFGITDKFRIDPQWVIIAAWTDMQKTVWLNGSNGEILVFSKSGGVSELKKWSFPMALPVSKQQVENLEEADLCEVFDENVCCIENQTMKMYKPIPISSLMFFTNHLSRFRYQDNFIYFEFPKCICCFDLKDKVCFSVFGHNCNVELDFIHRTIERTIRFGICDDKMTYGTFCEVFENESKSVNFEAFDIIMHFDECVTVSQCSLTEKIMINGKIFDNSTPIENVCVYDRVINISAQNCILQFKLVGGEYVLSVRLDLEFTAVKFCESDSSIFSYLVGSSRSKYHLKMGCFGEGIFNSTVITESSKYIAVQAFPTPTLLVDKVSAFLVEDITMELIEEVDLPTEMCGTASSPYEFNNEGAICTIQYEKDSRCFIRHIFNGRELFSERLFFVSDFLQESRFIRIDHHKSKKM
ncbi:hypothetical protein PCE1_004043 [Barthelona sp. PCE]